MFSKRVVYSCDDLRKLRPNAPISDDDNTTKKAIGSLTFETTYGYIAAPLKERRKHEKSGNNKSNKKHQHQNNKNHENDSNGVLLVESLKTTSNWADDDEDEEEEEEDDDDDDDDEEIIPIDHIQNRWIPPSMRRKLVSDEKNGNIDDGENNYKNGGDASSSEAIVAKAKSTLNKLTVERFEKLSNVFANIVYENEKDVSEIAEVVVLKAKAESHFASLYANLCVFVCGAESIGNNLITETLQDSKIRAVQLFKKSLLNHCQKLLTDVPNEENDVEYFKKPSPIKAKRSSNNDDKDDSGEELDKAALERKRYYGLVLFIGHLYRTKFLSCFIIHSMITKFLEGTPFVYGTIRPFFLVATCKLLDIAGKSLECGNNEVNKKSDQAGEIGFNAEDEIEKRHVFNNKWLAFYVEVFTVLLEKHEMLKKEMDNNDDDNVQLYAPRVIFAIRDLIELKESNWEPRRMNLKAKSLEQIKADRDAEEVRRKAEFLASKMALKQQALHGRELDTDGFETVAIGGRRGRNEGKRLAKQKEIRIKKAIAKGRHKHKGGNKSGKPPRYNNNNNKNNKGRYKSSYSNNSRNNHNNNNNHNNGNGNHNIIDDTSGNQRNE